MDRSTPRSTPSVVLLLAVAAALIWVGRGEATENGPSGNPIDSLTSVALPPTTTTAATALHPGLAAALRAAPSEAARAGTVITITSGFRTADEQARLPASAHQAHRSRAVALRGRSGERRRGEAGGREC